MKVICISGKARHGKDTVAEIMEKELLARGYRVLTTHYGDLLKYICKTFMGWNGEKDEKGRELLQQVGTNIIRKQAPDYWVSFIKDMLFFFQDYYDYVLIPDCRFKNEIDQLSAFSLISIRVNRSNFQSELTEAQKNHISEVALDDYEFDYVIENNSSLMELEQLVNITIKSIEREKKRA